MKPAVCTGLMPMFVYQFIEYFKPRNHEAKIEAQDHATTIASSVYELVVRLGEELDFDNMFEKEAEKYNAFPDLNQFMWWLAVVPKRDELNLKSESVIELFTSLICCCMGLHWKGYVKKDDRYKDKALELSKGVLWSYLQTDDDEDHFLELLSSCASITYRSGVPLEGVVKYIDSVVKLGQKNRPERERL